MLQDQIGWTRDLFRLEAKQIMPEAESRTGPAIVTPESFESVLAEKVDEYSGSEEPDPAALIVPDAQDQDAAPEQLHPAPQESDTPRAAISSDQLDQFAAAVPQTRQARDAQPPTSTILEKQDLANSDASVSTILPFPDVRGPIDTGLDHLGTAVSLPPRDGGAVATLGERVNLPRLHPKGDVDVLAGEPASEVEAVARTERAAGSPSVQDATSSETPYSRWVTAVGAHTIHVVQNPVLPGQWGMPAPQRGQEPAVETLHSIRGSDTLRVSTERALSDAPMDPKRSSVSVGGGTARRVPIFENVPRPLVPERVGRAMPVQADFVSESKATKRAHKSLHPVSVTSWAGQESNVTASTRSGKKGAWTPSERPDRHVVTTPASEVPKPQALSDFVARDGSARLRPLARPGPGEAPLFEPQTLPAPVADSHSRSIVSMMPGAVLPAPLSDTFVDRKISAHSGSVTEVKALPAIGPSERDDPQRPPAQTVSCSVATTMPVPIAAGRELAPDGLPVRSKGVASQLQPVETEMTELLRPHQHEVRRDLPDTSELRGASDISVTIRSGMEASVARADTVRQLSHQLVAGFQHRGAGQPVELQLNPIELGRVKLQMQSIENVMVVHIVVERPETLELLRRHMDLLAQDFRDFGYGNTRFTFSGTDTQAEPGGGRTAAEPGLLTGDGSGESQSLAPGASGLDKGPSVSADRLDIRM